jgi:hypothetical protein
MLWGPVGLILSTPLTVCLIVLGRHVPQLNFLEVILGDEPVLLPQQCFYQRLLASDPEEARTIADAQLRENSLESLYGLVILPALKLAEQDRGDNRIDDTQLEFVLQTVKELIEDLGEQCAEEIPDSTGKLLKTELVKTRIACIAAASGADALVATMLAQVLCQAGYDARTLGQGFLENATGASRDDYNMVAVSSISPFAVGQARSVCKALRAAFPGVRVVMGMWSFECEAARQRLGPACSGSVVNNLAEALAQIRQFVEPVPVAGTFEESDNRQDIPV